MLQNRIFICVGSFFYQNSRKIQFFGSVMRGIYINSAWRSNFHMRGRPSCENNRKSDFLKKEIILWIILTKGTPPQMKVWVVGKIYQNSPMPLQINASESISKGVSQNRSTAFNKHLSEFQLRHCSATTVRDIYDSNLFFNL